MAVQYILSSNCDEASITVIFPNGKTSSLGNSNTNFERLRELLATADYTNEQVEELVNPSLSAGTALRRLSERATYDNGRIYFDGDEIDDAIARQIVRIIKDGADENGYGALVKFLEKLYQNPSEKSRNSLYEFIQRWNITILDDGDFLVYKGVDEKGYSIHSGYGIVDGVVFERARLLNKPKSVIEIPRSKVDADTAVGCSTGLHAGSYEYASGFAQGMLLEVKVNPRDVVSVPDHCEFQKIRTSRYVVLSQTEIARKTATARFTADNDWADDRKNTASATLAPEAVEFAKRVDEEIATTGSALVNFTYKKAYESATEVKNFEITNSVNQWNDVLFNGQREDKSFRSYKLSRMSDFEFVNDPEVTDGELDTNDDLALATSKANHPSSALSAETKNNFEVVKNAIAAGDELEFNYVDSQNLSSHVTGFVPETATVKSGEVLVTGTNTAGQYRSYKASRISEISVTQDSPVVVDKWAAATFAALNEDNQ